jgi:acetyltransferase-like isoleucine patch superfamily enzyme
MIDLQETETLRSGYWTDGELPANAVVGVNSIITAPHAFKRFRSQAHPGLHVGDNCTMDGVHFSIGTNGRIEIGDYCYFTNALLLCEVHVRIGNYVVLGWNATIADSDFHPVAPAERLVDTLACSPTNRGLRRHPNIACAEVTIEDDVWIGPNATILKGVTIGEGSLIEPGALVTHSIPRRSRVLGNPARIIGKVQPQ